MKKFLIIGGDSKLAKCFGRIFEEQSLRLSKKECDITSEKSLRKAISKLDGDYVLNCAAITDIEACEQKPLECFNVNTFGVYLLNKICLEKNKKLIHISSNYAVNPVNNYGWSKYLAEKVVSKNFLVIRTSFYSNDFYIIKNISAEKKTNVYKNLTFNPISIVTLAKGIKANLDKKGILNLFSSKKISYLEFARLYCDIFGINKNLIRPARYKNKKIKRPSNSFVKSSKTINIITDMVEFKKFCEAYNKRT